MWGSLPGSRTIILTWWQYRCMVNLAATNQRCCTVHGMAI